MHMMTVSAEPSSVVGATPTTSASLSSVVDNVLAVNSSEAASLGGKKAKTPIIAGSICGGVMGLAWIIGFAIYFRKRYKRKQRKRLAARGIPVPPREKEGKNSSEEKIIIPPDPAVLLGQRKPGEFAFAESSHSNRHNVNASHTEYHPPPAALSDTPHPNTTTEGSAGQHIPILSTSADTFYDRGNSHNV